jgi:micrococcal nuclease
VQHHRHSHHREVHHRHEHRAPKPAPKKTHRSRPPSAKPQRQAPGVVVSVVRVVDGDTIHVLLHGRDTDIRLIGIDTPETVDPGEPVMCYGPAASSFTHRELDGATARLRFDVERTDRYGRTLAYVYKDGRMFNLTLVRRGYARAYPYEPNTRNAGLFAAAQAKARAHQLGLWGACPYFGAPAHGSSASTGQGGSSAGGSASGKCNPNYAGACIPDSSQDLDCSDVSASNFRVVGQDVYGFDGDGDRIACES